MFKWLSQPRRPVMLAAALLLSAGALYAADSWSSDNPYWCYSGAEACGLWSSPNHYVGPTYTGCEGVSTGWRSEGYILTYCDVS
jgi:hypothetical protein